jgi:hypothetical protein
MKEIKKQDHISGILLSAREFTDREEWIQKENTSTIFD